MEESLSMPTVLPGVLDAYRHNPQPLYQPVADNAVFDLFADTATVDRGTPPSKNCTPHGPASTVSGQRGPDHMAT